MKQRYQKLFSHLNSANLMYYMEFSEEKVARRRRRGRVGVCPHQPLLLVLCRWAQMHEQHLLYIADRRDTFKISALRRFWNPLTRSWQKILKTPENKTRWICGCHHVQMKKQKRFRHQLRYGSHFGICLRKMFKKFKSNNSSHFNTKALGFFCKNSANW